MEQNVRMETPNSFHDPTKVYTVSAKSKTFLFNVLFSAPLLYTPQSNRWFEYGVATNR